jgi:hypothetical protein
LVGAASRRRITTGFDHQISLGAIDLDVIPLIPAHAIAARAVNFLAFPNRVILPDAVFEAAEQPALADFEVLEDFFVTFVAPDDHNSGMLGHRSRTSNTTTAHQ